MNIGVKCGLFFVGGVIAGVGATYLYFKRQSDKEIEATRDYYIHTWKPQLEKRLAEEYSVRTNEQQEKRVKDMSNKISKEVERTNYHEIYVPKTGEVTGEEVAAEVTGKNGAIYIIDINEFGSNPDYDAETLDYYLTQGENGLLYDNYTASTIDPMERFGESIVKTLKTTTETSVYIRDETIGMDYEIAIMDSEDVDAS